MTTLDPSLRQAAQRVTAWHVARWRPAVDAEPAVPPFAPAPDGLASTMDGPAPSKNPAPQDFPAEQIS
jgi:hypothetical protein